MFLLFPNVVFLLLLTTAVAVPAPSEAQLRIRDSATKAMILFGGRRGEGWGPGGGAQ